VIVADASRGLAAWRRIVRMHLLEPPDENPLLAAGVPVAARTALWSAWTAYREERHEQESGSPTPAPAWTAPARAERCNGLADIVGRLRDAVARVPLPEDFEIILVRDRLLGWLDREQAACRAAAVAPDQPTYLAQAAQLDDAWAAVHKLVLTLYTALGGDPPPEPIAPPTHPAHPHHPWEMVEPPDPLFPL
jgi:hypothetical protein